MSGDEAVEQTGVGGQKMPMAVALKYDRGNDPAPRITASGKGAIAEQIVQLAFANGVKVRQDAPLVEILSMIEVDSLIPLEAYAAVAEILSYVYKANSAERYAQEVSARKLNEQQVIDEAGLL